MTSELRSESNSSTDFWFASIFKGMRISSDRSEERIDSERCILSGTVAEERLRAKAAAEAAATHNALAKYVIGVAS